MSSTAMMPLVYNESFEMIGVLDVYESLIWTERYDDVGDFELTTMASTEYLNMLKIGYYLLLSESDVSMVIETIKIDTDAEDGDKLTISGRSLESILDRRIVWEQTDLDSKIETAIERLLNDSVINPSNADRKIPGFLFVPSGDAAIDAIKVKKQYTGDVILEAIKELCGINNVGFKLTANPEDQTFQFKLYFGKDRSYAQEENSFVVFSPSFDNLTGSNYTESKKLNKNVAQVKGDGEGKDRTTISVAQGTPKALARKEMFVDANDISRTKENSDQTYTKEEYENLLIERARKEMYDISDEKSFEGESNVVSGVFVYGKDFYMGDIVQVENQFGLGDTVRITELIRSADDDGFKVYPTFTSTSEKKDEVISE